MSSEKSVRRISRELESFGRRAYEIAREVILSEEKINYEPLREAISYFIDLWRNYHHPALLSIACEAVGGNPEKTVLIGAALVLLTGAADIHDDIIDRSKVKGSKETLYGKFGEDLSIIAGDVLFVEGLTLLNIACGNLPKEQSEKVQKIVKQGFLELGVAEAEEASFKGDWKLDPEKYLDIIRRKASIAEVAARIGAIIGGASSEEVESWGKIGRTLSISMNIRDEFVDVFEAEELKNRRDNECLPLPVLYAMRNPKARKKIIQLLEKKELTDEDVVKIAEVMLGTREVRMFKVYIKNLMTEGICQLKKFNAHNKAIKLLRTLLKLTLKDL